MTPFFIKREHITQRVSQRPPGYLAALAPALIHEDEHGAVYDVDHAAWREAKQRYQPTPAPDPAAPRPPAAKAPQATPSLKSVWGPPLWHELHARPFLPGYNASGEAEWLTTFTSRIPCGDCRQHWLQNLQALPPDLSSAENYFAWTVTIHNRVNAHLGKPHMELAAAWSLHVSRL